MIAKGSFPETLHLRSVWYDATRSRCSLSGPPHPHYLPSGHHPPPEDIGTTTPPLLSLRSLFAWVWRLLFPLLYNLYTSSCFLSGLFPGPPAPSSGALSFFNARWRPLGAITASFARPIVPRTDGNEITTATVSSNERRRPRGRSLYVHDGVRNLELDIKDQVDQGPKSLGAFAKVPK